MESKESANGTKKSMQRSMISAGRTAESALATQRWTAKKKWHDEPISLIIKKLEGIKENGREKADQVAEILIACDLLLTKEYGGKVEKNLLRRTWCNYLRTGGRDGTPHMFHGVRISKQLYKAFSAKGKRTANKYSKKQLKKLQEDPPEPDTPKFEKLSYLEGGGKLYETVAHSNPPRGKPMQEDNKLCNVLYSKLLIKKWRKMKQELSKKIDDLIDKGVEKKIDRMRQEELERLQSAAGSDDEDAKPATTANDKSAGDKVIIMPDPNLNDDDAADKAAPKEPDLSHIGLSAKQETALREKLHVRILMKHGTIALAKLLDTEQQNKAAEDDKAALEKENDEGDDTEGTFHKVLVPADILQLIAAFSSYLTPMPISIYSPESIPPL